MTKGAEAASKAAQRAAFQDDLPDYPALRFLQERAQWVAWDRRGMRKVPVNAKTGTNARVNDPNTWSDYPTAADRARSGGLAGVGFMLTDDGGIIGIDLDSCRNADTSMLEPWAAKLVGLKETYTEVSPSGRGLRMFALAQADVEDLIASHAGVEVYANGGRYLTITGDHVPEAPVEIATAPRTLAMLQERVAALAMPPSNADGAPTRKWTGSPTPFSRVNSAALQNLDAWVPILLPAARRHGKGYRVTSEDLGRPLEEDLSITPWGIKDFGVHDQGDARRGKRTPIDLVLEYAADVEIDVQGPAGAGIWLCEQLGVEPSSLSFRASAFDFVNVAPLESRPATSFKSQAAADYRPPATSDESLALRYAADHSDDLRYVAKWSRWMIWRDGLWREDSTLLAYDIARALCRKEAAACTEERAARVLASAKTVAAVHGLSRSDRRLAATDDQWDLDPDLLNTPDGTVDLRSGILRAHDRSDYCSKMTSVAPAPQGTPCPLWMRFLDRVTQNDAALIAYLQRVAGYSLTGSVKENALFFAYGTGRNGKGVFINTIARIMGSYAATAVMETFVASNAAQHPTDLAGLRGARLVSAQETEDGRRWAESKIKALTGGDPISARFMRQDFFTFHPQFKLLIAGNHKPSLRSVDEAIKARFNLIPFTVFIPEEERDPDLQAKLVTEWPAILRWGLDGCLEWRRDGLNAPAAVRVATREYLAEEDSFTRWLDECCERVDGAREGSTELFTSWKRWAELAGEFIGTQKKLSQSLKVHFVEKRLTGGRAGFEGVSLKVKGSEGFYG